MFWNDQELDHVLFVLNPRYMCLAAQEMVKLSVIECQKHWNFMTKLVNVPVWLLRSKRGTRKLESCINTIHRS